MNTSHIDNGKWFTYSPDETFDLGKRVGSQLTGGEIILLDGPLGAGKTVFVKGIASAMDVDPEDVTSPSFTLVNIYPARLPFFHIDLYRLDEGLSAANAVDLEELLSDASAVVVIEWGERLGRYPLPPDALRIVFRGDGDDVRVITISQD